MIILIHVLIAVASMIQVAVSYTNPTKSKITTSYILMASTLASGTYLVVSSQAGMLRACASGIAFLVATSVVVQLSKAKLAKQES